MNPFSATRFPSRPHASGFSIVEAVALSAVIVLVVSILLPALSHGAQDAKGVTCQGNQKLIFAAMEAYYADAENPEKTMPCGQYLSGGSAPYHLTDTKAPEEARGEDGILPNGLGWLLFGGYVGKGDALYDPAIEGEWVHNGDPGSAMALKEGLNQRGQGGYRYPETTNTAEYNHNARQYRTRTLNEQRRRAIYYCMLYPWGRKVFAHGGEFVNATYFDGTVVKHEGGYKPDKNGDGAPDGYNYGTINRGYPEE